MCAAPNELQRLYKLVQSMSMRREKRAAKLRTRGMRGRTCVGIPSIGTFGRVNKDCDAK